MTAYIRDIHDQWNISRDATRRNRLYGADINTLPYGTIQRIVACFDLPDTLQEYSLHFGEFFNLPEFADSTAIKGIVPPNVSGAEIFQKEFELARALHSSFNLLLGKKPRSQNVQRQFSKTKNKVKKALSDLNAALTIPDRYTKALILSGFGSGMYQLDKRISDLIKGVEKSRLNNYKGYHARTQLRDGAILSLAYSYFYCFGEHPKTTQKSVFFQYVDRFFSHDLMQESDDALAAAIKNAVKTIKLTPNANIS